VLPIKVRLCTDRGVAWTTGENDGRVHNYCFTWPGLVSYVDLDPEKWILRQMPGGGTVDAPAAAAGLALSARPNPFNPRTTLRLELPAAGPVQLAIFDAAGRRVRDLVTGDLPAGVQEVVWDGGDESGRRVASGTYYARLVAAGRSSVGPLVRVK